MFLKRPEVSRIFDAVNSTELNGKVFKFAEREDYVFVAASLHFGFVLKPKDTIGIGAKKTLTTNSFRYYLFSKSGQRVILTTKAASLLANHYKISLDNMINRYVNGRNHEEYQVIKDYTFPLSINSALENDKGNIMVRWAKLDNGLEYIRSIFSENYSVLNNQTVIKALYDIVENSDLEIAPIFFDGDGEDFHLRAEIITPNHSSERAIGEIQGGGRDIVRYGFDLKNSENGATSLMISPMLFRLVCSNGLTVVEDSMRFRQKHVHKEGDFLEAYFVDTMQKVFAGNSALVDGFVATKQILLPNPTGLIDATVAYKELNNTVARDLQHAYLRDKDPSLFGVINAFTRAARQIPNAKGVVNKSRLGLETIASEMMISPGVFLSLPVPSRA